MAPPPPRLPRDSGGSAQIKGFIFVSTIRPGSVNVFTRAKKKFHKKSQFRTYFPERLKYVDLNHKLHLYIKIVITCTE